MAPHGNSNWFWNRSVPVNDSPDPTRVDLFERFFRNPRGRHDLEVQALVSGVRGSVRIPRFILARVDRQRWQVLKLPSHRGMAPEIVGGQMFSDRDDAERFVMNLRLSLLADIDQMATEQPTG
jgi:hypothetical protein